MTGLERMGLARRRPHPTDRRSVRVEMTEPGAEIIARRRALRVRRLAASLRAVDDHELRRLADALQVLDRVTLDVLREEHGRRQRRS